MIVNSSRLGPREVSEDEIIQFPRGLLGFEELTRYVVLTLPDPDSDVRVLQAVDDPAVGFIVVDPRIFRPDYTLKLQDQDWTVLGCSGPVPPEELQVFVILTVYERPEQMTANLLAPVVIHRANRLGRQVVQEGVPYTVRHNVLEELRRVAPEADPSAAGRDAPSTPLRQTASG